MRLIMNFMAGLSSCGAYIIITNSHNLRNVHVQSLYHRGYITYIYINLYDDGSLSVYNNRSPKLGKDERLFHLLESVFSLFRKERKKQYLFTAFRHATLLPIDIGLRYIIKNLPSPPRPNCNSARLFDRTGRSLVARISLGINWISFVWLRVYN